MQELFRKDWNYILYQEEEKFILSVLCGTVALYNVDITLTEEETQQYLQEGIAYLDILAQSVQSQPTLYMNRKTSV